MDETKPKTPRKPRVPKQPKVPESPTQENEQVVAGPAPKVITLGVLIGLLQDIEHRYGDAIKVFKVRQDRSIYAFSPTDVRYVEAVGSGSTPNAAHVEIG